MTPSKSLADFTHHHYSCEMLTQASDPSCTCGLNRAKDEAARQDQRRIEMQNRISHLERTLQSVLDRGMPK